MITTLIKYENNNTISLNPVDLGHSSVYQEFRNKIFSNKSTNTTGSEFIVTKTEPIKVTTSNIQNLTSGYYYPYVLFTLNGKLDKIILVSEKQKPLNSKYYTRINYKIYITKYKMFQSFNEVRLINNQLDDSHIISTINSTKDELMSKNMYDTYIYSVVWYGNTNFSISNNTSKTLIQPEKYSTTTLRLHFRNDFLKSSDIIQAELSVDLTRIFNLVAISDISTKIVESVSIDNDFSNNWISIKASNDNTLLTILEDIGSYHNRCDLIIRKKE